MVTATNQWGQESLPSVISNTITPRSNLRNINTNVTNGTISGSQAILVGQSIKITYSTEIVGFGIDSIYINGLYDSAATHDSLTSYTFFNIQENVVFKVVYGLQTFIIAASAGVGGSINPTGNNIVNYGARPTFTIVPTQGYEIDSVLVNGIKVDSINSYTFDSVKMNQTIRVVFDIISNKPRLVSINKVILKPNDTLIIRGRNLSSIELIPFIFIM
ncbi:MAG: hypothetical protein ORN85_02795 [Sediminibacterium sp.]|nr:hypothetical protein [Sediminibacterium sp.]